MPIAAVASTELCYQRAGDRGPPVVFIQGVAAVGAGWRPQTDALADECRALWFDNRGVGGSAAHTGPLSIEQLAGDTLALMDHVGWERAHVVGHSMGGIIAQQIAVDAPERVASLSLISTFARGKDVGADFARSLWMFLRIRFGTRRSRRRAAVDMVFPRAWQARVGVDALAESLEEVFGGDPTAYRPIAVTQVRACRGSDLFEQLAAVSAPTLVIGGAQDRIAPIAQSEQLASQIPGARLEVFADAGHAVTIQCADEVNALLREHIVAASDSQ